MKLNLGCAKDVKEGYINVDLHYKHPNIVNEDISNLSFVKENSVEEIIAKDVLEHLPLNKSLECLKIWYKYLKNEGAIYIQTTNFLKIKQAFENNVWDINVLNHMLFAGPSWINGKEEDCDFHKSTYTVDFLTKELTNIGYKIISIEQDEIDYILNYYPKAHNLNLKIWAKK
jgi:hypothetical protein